MPNYSYIAAAPDGRQVRGEMIANDNKDLAAILSKDGLFLISCHAKDGFSAEGQRNPSLAGTLKSVSPTLPMGSKTRQVLKDLADQLAKHGMALYAKLAKTDSTTDSPDSQGHRSRFSSLPRWLKTPRALRVIGTLFAICMIYNLFRFVGCHRRRPTGQFPIPAGTLESTGSAHAASQSFQIQNVKAEAVKSALGMMLAWSRPPASASVDKKSNTLTVHGSTATLSAVAEALTVLDQPLAEKDSSRQGMALFVKLNNYFRNRPAARKAPPKPEPPAPVVP